MSYIAVPASTPSRRWIFWLALPAVVLLFTILYWAFSRIGSGGGSATVGGQFYTVVPMPIDVKIIKDGELQAVNNIDIVCQVEGGTTIQTIVKEGTTIKKGEVLATLDSSAIKQKIEDTTLDLQKAEADVTNAREMKSIQESQNATNLEAAQVALTLAKLDLSGYTEGTYPQQLSKANTDLELTQLALKNKQESLAQTRGLFNKGFVTAADVKTAEQDSLKAEIDLGAAQNALEVLTKYTHESDLASKRNALSQAEQKLVRVQRENAANLNQKEADVQAKEQNYAVLKRRGEHLKDQLDACTIEAPADGMVVYSSSGDRNAQNPIQEGSQVRERQPLLRLPDTATMKSIVRISESQVSSLREGMRAKVSVVGMKNPIGGTINKISVLADSGQRWWNPDQKDYPVDVVLDETPAGLKPGMTVKTEILISRVDNTLAVPLGSIYSGGNDAYVFVREGKRTTPAKVRIGQSNDTHAQVVSGVTAGQDVKLLGAGEGRDLLEQAGIKVEGPSTKPDDFGVRRRGNGGGPGGGGPGGGGQGGAPGGGPGGGRRQGGGGPGGGAPGGASGGSPGGQMRGGGAPSSAGPTTGPSQGNG